MTDLTNYDLDLSYPCAWVYKIIGESESAVREVVREVLGERECEIRLSRSSSSGKYCCLNVELTVVDAADRLEVYSALGAHPLTRIVL